MQLGTPELTWHDLGVIVRQAPPGSALRRANSREAADWSTTDYLLVDVLNLLSNISWQLGGDEKAPKPEPILGPGQKPAKTGPTLRGDLMPIEELEARLGWGDERR